MKGDDPEVLADLVFLLASIGKASGDRIEKMPEQIRTELRTSQIKAFVKTLNGENCEETIAARCRKMRTETKNKFKRRNPL